jgi:hypothetical protein
VYFHIKSSHPAGRPCLHVVEPGRDHDSGINSKDREDEDEVQDRAKIFRAAAAATGVSFCEGTSEVGALVGLSGAIFRVLQVRVLPSWDFVQRTLKS